MSHLVHSIHHSVSLDQFIEPTITSCGHSFCNECIKKTIDLGNGKCPLCKKCMSKKNIISNKKLKDIQNQMKEMKDQESLTSQYSEMMQHSLFKEQEEPKLPSKTSTSTGREVVILVTLLNWQIRDEFEKFSKKFCCKVVTHYNQNVTHLLVGFDDKKQFKASTSKKLKIGFEAKRTVKFLQALVQGKWIISYKWIVHSLIALKLLNEEEFEIEGDGHASGTPRRSREIGGMKDLFKDYKFTFMATQKKSIESKGIQIPELKWMIEQCGGQVYQKQDEEIYVKICLMDEFVDLSENREEVFSHLWILDSISHFCVQDKELYQV